MESARLPSGRDWRAVTTERDTSSPTSKRTTYVIDYHTDRLYEAMCRSRPSSLPEDRWKALFPHLGHRDSRSGGE